jgi:hypothetical protein
MSNEEIKIYRKLNRDEEFDAEQKERMAKEKALEHKFNDIVKKIEDGQVISREEFALYEKHEKFETYTKNYYTFQCPKCSDSYDVIMRSRTDDEKIVQVIYVEDEKVENE